jgi:hypothetical protein
MVRMIQKWKCKKIWDITGTVDQNLIQNNKRTKVGEFCKFYILNVLHTCWTI